MEADWAAGRVHVVRGGKRLAKARHHLAAAGLSERRWRERWRAERMFLAADGESGNGTRPSASPTPGQLSIKLPAPLARLANASHGQYLLDATVAFTHRGEEWRDRVTANRAVAYRIHHRHGARTLVCDRLVAARRRTRPAA
ncbi:IS605 OrfB family transposase OS=Streptomyces violarus OX=67380 GN=FHS41_006930 PE=4 SV=1 [Streptomyces violarus]